MNKTDEKLLEKYPNLKRQEKDVAPSSYNYHKWTIENIRDGFQYFHDLNGRYPITMRDVNGFEYLPTTRQIQRSFGGMKALRQNLNLGGPTDYSRGETRSKVAGDRKRKSYEDQAEFYQFLVSKLPEVRVHEQKFIRPGNVSSDFFIYTSDTRGIVIDIFYAQDIETALKIISIKRTTYSEVIFPTYFILVGNDKIRQEDFDAKIANRKIPLRSNVKVLTETELKANFGHYVPGAPAAE